MITKTVLITGATGEIGNGLLKKFLKINAKVILLDKNKEKLLELTNTLKKNNKNKYQVITCDLEHEDQRYKAIEEIKSSNNVIDCLINNAAFVGTSNLSGWTESFQNQSLDTWRRAIEVNVTAPFHLIRDLSEVINKSKNGNIINICSIYGHIGPDWRLYNDTEGYGNPAAYSVSKGGLLQLTRWCATTLAPKIRTNAISPGGIFRQQPKNFVDKYVSMTPLKRMAKVEDVVGAVMYLSSDDAQYVTGQTIVVDGGFIAW